MQDFGSEQWVTYRELSKIHGAPNRRSLQRSETSFLLLSLLGSDLIHLNMAGTHIIVANSAQTASDLFEKQALIYADR
jgi:hypothetical protein